VSTREAALGFDVGTTSVKAGLLWLDREEPMDVVSMAHATARPRAGWVEQDPADWLEGMARCWSELERRRGPFRLRSIGICSQVNTHLLVDGELRPLHPAITWQDTRATAEAGELDTLAGPRRDQLWGGPFRVDASFSLARLAWLGRHQPEALASARWMMSPKDYCVAAICGEVVTDTISPIGLVDRDGRYIDGVLELVDGAARLVPPLRAFDSIAGVVSGDAPLGLPAGVPVAVGTMDAWGNVFGSGLVRPGQAMEVAGTSEILAVLSDRAVPTPGIITFAPVHGRILHAGPTQAGGAALEWAATCFAVSVERMLMLAQEGLRDPRPILFLPHLAGERAPHWNPEARGVFVGLDSTSELPHLALAVLEGVAFAARQSLEGCEQAAGRPADELRLSGGAARSHLWNRIKATAQGRPMSVMETLDSAVLGAALIGLVAGGLQPDMDRAAARHARVAAVIDPDPGGRARADDHYGAYRDSYQALVPIFSRLASHPTPDAGERGPQRSDAAGANVG
jgi:xylulokinase